MIAAQPTRWWTPEDALRQEQERLGVAEPPPWRPGPGPLVAGGCFVAFARGEQGPGHAGDHGWGGAALVLEDGTLVVDRAVPARADGPYVPGLLAQREAPILLAALAALPRRPDVALIDATGLDHPRRCGLARHLGAVLDLPTVGVTHRPLLAAGAPPTSAEAGAWSSLVLDGEEVARWVVTRSGVRPVVAHAGWRTDPATAAEVVLRFAHGARTPEPLRLARCAAREARASRPPRGSVASLDETTRGADG